VVTGQPKSLVMVDDSKGLTEVVVHNLLTSGVFSFAHGLWFFPQLGFSPTSQGFDDVCDRRSFLRLARKDGCLDRRDSLVNCTDTEWYRFYLAPVVQKRAGLTFESSTEFLL